MVTPDPTGFARSLRWIEWIAVGAALFVFSGAVFPLLMGGSDGMLDPTEKARLRYVNLPVYALILGAMVQRPMLPVRAMARNLPMLMLVVLTFASVTWSLSSGITLRRAVALMLSMSLACLLATRFTPRQQILLLAVVMGGATALSLLAAVALPGLAYLPGDSALRGIFVHKNVLGWVASFTVLLGIAAQKDLSRRFRRGGWALVVIGGAGTVLSGSATSLIAAVTALLFVIGANVLVHRRGLARLATKLLLLIVTILLLGGLILGLLPLLEMLGKDATLTGRVPLWGLVTPEIARHPFLGQGYGAFWSEANPVAWRIWAEAGWQAPHAHEGYLDLLLGVGAVGLALFVLVTVRALQQGTELCTAAPHDGWFWCVAAIGTSLAMNLSESTFLMQNDLMWVLFATSALTISLRHAELVQTPPRHVRLAQAAV
ncbi:putative O-glycosylation ligase, exosortase A-associated (plasmid) [Paracoccaceae bacterium]|nr:putative O-glycosylation ligase, exosortase A-associated [Paracoccaceae bacterium]